MGWRTRTAPSTWVTVAGLASVFSLMVTAAAGLWLDFAYHPDASSAWDDIEALQNEIDRGFFVADLRRSWSVIALAATTVWLGLMASVRDRLALVIALVLVVSVLALGPGREGTVVERSILECAAAAMAAAAAARWLLRSRHHIVASADTRVG